MYWDPKKTFKQKTNSEFADDIARFIDGYNVRGLYLDPSAESFSIELKRRGIRCLEADNDVFPGITFVANLISNHQLKILDTCPNLIRETEMYVWDPKKSARGIEEPIKQNDHCFCTGTLISTDIGQIPIEMIKVGDFVHTRQGLKVVERIGCNVKDAYEFIIHGKIVRCTGDHKFFTERGWIDSSCLTQSDILYTNDFLWVNKDTNISNQSNLTEKDTDAIQSLRDCMIETTSLPTENIFIEVSGSSIMGRFPLDTIFITKTGTPLTMIFPICNVSQQKNMSDCMSTILDLIGSRMRLEMQPPCGIDQRQEENGTESMQERCNLVNGKKGNSFVSNANQNSELQRDPLQDFVRITVNQNGEEKLALMMSKRTALSVQKNSYRIDTIKPIAVPNHVEKRFLGKESVYNLQIRDCHEFFAEGFLVHNSVDALRYVLFSAFGKKMSMDTPKIEEAKQFEDLRKYGFR